MTKIKMILMALVASVTMATAGGDIAPVAQVVEVAPVTKDFYVGVHGTANQAFEDRDWFNDTDVANSFAYGLGLQGGYTFLRSGDFSTAVEGRVTYTFMGTDADSWTGDALLKPAYAFGDVNVYALAGYSYTDYDTSIATIGDDYVDGFVWGGGVEYAVTDTYGVFVDYTVRPDLVEDIVSNEVVTVGLNYKF